MTAEGDRRNPPPGRRLTDNQLLAKFKRDEETHRDIERDIQGSNDSIASLGDELTAFRFETRTQFAESKADRDKMKAEIAAAHNENREQFAGIGECINDLKAWQYDFDRQQEREARHQTERDRRDEAAYAEILANFEFQKALKVRLLKLAAWISAIGGAFFAAQALWEHTKHLFTHGSP